MEAWITLLSTINYLPAVLVLNETLKQNNTKYPLVVGIAEDIWEDSLIKILLKNGIIPEKITKLTYSISVQKKHKGETVLNTASKISLFSLINYDKLVFIDADVYIKENIDELFNYKDGSILCYFDDKVEGQLWGFSSLFVFKPLNHRWKEYNIIMNALNSFDGDFIGRTWFHIRDNEEYRIPDYYMKLANNSGYCKTVHLINPENKFWLIPEPRFKKSQIEIDYYKILNQIYLTNPEILDIINT